MSNSADYRQEAKGYIQQAQGPVLLAHRTRLLDMAQSCIRMAEQVEWLESLSYGLGDYTFSRGSG
jgi:hypothetical protein